MKKLVLVAMVASFATAAFAQKHMVRFYGWDTGMRADSFDFSLATDDEKDNELDRMNIALNYAYAINDTWQVGGTYKSLKETRDDKVVAVGDESTTIGLSGYYNVHGNLTDTCYFGLHYNMTTNEDKEGMTDSGNEMTTIALEYGHRWKVGSAWGFTATYAPNVMYAMSTTEPNADGADDVKGTSLAWNFLKFDVLF